MREFLQGGKRVCRVYPDRRFGKAGVGGCDAGRSLAWILPQMN